MKIIIGGVSPSPPICVTPFVGVIPTYTQNPLGGSSLCRYSPGKHLWAVELWVVLCGNHILQAWWSWRLRMKVTAAF